MTAKVTINERLGGIAECCMLRRDRLAAELEAIRELDRAGGSQTEVARIEAIVATVLIKVQIERLSIIIERILAGDAGELAELVN